MNAIFPSTYQEDARLYSDLHCLTEDVTTFCRSSKAQCATEQAVNTSDVTQEIEAINEELSRLVPSLLSYYHWGLSQKVPAQLQSLEDNLRSLSASHSSLDKSVKGDIQTLLTEAQKQQEIIRFRGRKIFRAVTRSGRRMAKPEMDPRREFKIVTETVYTRRLLTLSLVASWIGPKAHLSNICEAIRLHEDVIDNCNWSMSDCELGDETKIQVNDGSTTISKVRTRLQQAKLDLFDFKHRMKQWRHRLPLNATVLEVANDLCRVFDNIKDQRTILRNHFTSPSVGETLWGEALSSERDPQPLSGNVKEYFAGLLSLSKMDARESLHII